MIRSSCSCTSKLLPILLLALISGAAAPGIAAQSSPPPAVGSFVWISDIHFDPFYAPTSQDSDASAVTALLDQLVARAPGMPTWKDPSQWHAIFKGSTLQNIYNARGSDANDAVFQEVLLKASQTHPQPDFVLLTGDLLGHDFGSDYSTYAPDGMNNGDAYRSFVAKTLEYLALSIRDRFPTPPIIATLGNNDAYCGDYDIHLDRQGSPPSGDGSTFLPDTAAVFLKYFLPNLTAAEKTAFEKTFLEGGYYTVPVPQGGGSRFLVVNSIPFMAKYPCEACHCDGGGDGCTRCGAACGSYPNATFQSSCAASPVIDAAAQMKWLTTEAQKAGAGTAWVVAHVPPGKGCYDSSPMWESSYLTPFENLFVGGSPAKVAGTLAAHSHMASFKLVRDSGGKAVSFVVQAPSIGSNHSNNPTFGVLAHDRSTLEIQSYQVYALDLPNTTWSPFPFAGLSGAITASTLSSLYTKLGDTSRSEWATFEKDYGSRAPICSGSCNPSCVCLGDLSQSNLICLDSLD